MSSEWPSINPVVYVNDRIKYSFFKYILMSPVGLDLQGSEQRTKLLSALKTFNFLQPDPHRPVLALDTPRMASKALSL